MSADDRLAARLGLWMAGTVTVLGVVYGIGLVVLTTTTDVRLTRPSAAVQFGVAVGTLAVAQVVLAMFACVHRMVPAALRTLTHIAVLFAALFAAMVSINRFVQLTAVRRVLTSGDAGHVASGAASDAASDAASAVFALEVLGWGFFLSLAVLALALAFRGGRLQSAVRWTGVTYAALSLAGTVGYAAGNRLFVVGFVAWGGVFYVWSALLAVWFRAQLRSARASNL